MQFDLLNNPLFVGGGAIGIFGALGLWFKTAASNAFYLIKKEIITTVEINENDDSFEYVEHFLSEHDYAKRNKSTTVKTSWKNNLPRFKLIPSTGLHIFKDDGKWYWLIRNRKELQNANSNKAYSDTILLNSFNSNRSEITEFLNKCYILYSKDTNINIYYWNDGYWNFCTNKDRSEQNSMILTNEQSEIVNDADNFVNSKEWYDANGVPWRRGYLFYGAPGGGKSRLAIELAKKLGYTLYYVNLADESLNDGKLVKMFADASKKSIIMIEEIDTIFDKRKKVDESFKSNSISFGGLLNVLDGIIAKDGRIVIMTTNHPEKLDEALTRPGRIDKQVFFGFATYEQVCKMVDRFFGENNSEELKKFIFERNLTMAKLQELCIEYKNKSDKLVEELQKND